MNMLDHQKLLLQNLFHDEKLFEKELKKSINWLHPDDIKKLYIWVKKNFWTNQKEAILRVFTQEFLPYDAKLILS